MQSFERAARRQASYLSVCGKALAAPYRSGETPSFEEGVLQYSSQVVLESFFRDLFTRTTVGYVLYGQKPLSLESFPYPEETMPGTPRHFLSVQSLLSSDYLKTIKTDKKYQVIVHKNEFVFTNKESFFKTIKNNLILFQYKFGTKITPKAVLQKLKDNNFSSLFKEDVALQGIILGYGAENAISYEKGSRLKKGAPPVPPYQTLPFPKNASEIAAVMKPIQDEIEDLTHYKKTDPNDSLKIPFSYHKNSPKTEALINSYRADQAKVDSVLKNKNFLNQVIRRLGGKLNSQQKKAFHFSEEEIKILPQLLAQSITHAFAEELSPAFFEGMKAAEQLDDFVEDQNLKFLSILREQNFQLRAEINRYFNRLAPKPNLQCLIPRKLYFEKLKEGTSDKTLTFRSQLIKACYVFKDSKGYLLHGSFAFEDPTELSIEKLIPGLAHGILGMKEGEIREIFIHPDFVYGTSSKFGNGEAIQVKIELLELVKEGLEHRFPLLKPLDVFHYAPEISSCADFSTLQEKHAYLCGFKTWIHYKKASFPLDQIIDEMKKNPPTFPASQSPLLLKLEWLLYKGS